MLDASGASVAHTGDKCIPAAGHIVGENFSVQANLMLNDKVWPEMARAFRAAKGDLADKMLAALDAAQAVGGDIRGRQSAAILVVKSKGSGRPWLDRIMDLRVEDSEEPLRELRRLVLLHRAYEHMNQGDLAVEAGDAPAALREYGAAEILIPGNLEMKFWHAVALVNMGRVDESLPLFRAIFSKDKNWATLFPRLPQVDLLKADQKTLDRILALSEK
jgi:uncharacterized Ntn-hydrolase superfamily protein